MWLRYGVLLFLNELTSIWSTLPAAMRSGERLSSQKSGVHNPVFSGKSDSEEDFLTPLPFFDLWRCWWQLSIPVGLFNTVWTFHIHYGAGIQHMIVVYLVFYVCLHYFYHCTLEKNCIVCFLALPLCMFCFILCINACHQWVCLVAALDLRPNWSHY